MAVYIAFIRGVNVGGKNKMKMAELKVVLESTGLSRVGTYIQSGNVIFESDETEEILRTKLEHEIERNFAISTDVILRTADELERLVQARPFSDKKISNVESMNTEGESLYVDLLIKTPSEEQIKRLEALGCEDGEYRICNRDVYLLLHTSIRKSKLAIGLQKLEAQGTLRNWKTLNRLYENIQSSRGEDTERS